VDVNSITQVISQVGFPIFVAVWLLWKGDQQNKQIVDALNELKIAVTILAEKMGAGGENGGK
jgi:hypothetical protein